MCRFADEYGALIDPALLQFYDVPPADFVGKYVGVDVGSSHDNTAIVTACQRPDGSLFIDDAVVLHRTDYQRQLEVLKELNQRHCWAGGFVDSVGIGGPIAEFANKQVSARIGAWAWTAQNKPPAYENFRALVFDRKLQFSSRFRDLLLSDFKNIRRIVSETGKVSYEAGRNRDGHSDVASALVLALQAAKDKPIGLSAPVSFCKESRLGSWSSRLGGGVSLW